MINKKLSENINSSQERSLPPRMFKLMQESFDTVFWYSHPLWSRMKTIWTVDQMVDMEAECCRQTWDDFIQWIRALSPLRCCVVPADCHRVWSPFMHSCILRITYSVAFGSCLHSAVNGSYVNVKWHVGPLGFFAVREATLVKVRYGEFIIFSCFFTSFYSATSLFPRC